MTRRSSRAAPLGRGHVLAHPGWPGLALLACFALTACGGDGRQPDPTSTPPDSSESGQTGGAELVGTPIPPTVGQIVWAAAVQPGTNEPIERVERIASDAESLYVVAPVVGLPIGSTLSAEWRYNGVPLDQMDSQLTTTSANGTEWSWVEFHLTRESGASWPDGTYSVTISLDGAARQESSIEVVEA